MRKRDELSNPKSCMVRAKDDEMTFVLLGRDVTAPNTIRHWVALRLAAGKNQYDDQQILEALACADAMEADQLKSRPSSANRAEGRPCTTFAVGSTGMIPPQPVMSTFCFAAQPVGTAKPESEKECEL